MKRLLKLVKGLYNSVTDAVADSIRIAGRFLADVVLQLLDFLLPLSRIAHWVKLRSPSFWKWLMGIGWIGRVISRRTFDKFANLVPSRPNAFSMLQDYPTLRGFVDRSITGRHLPPPKAPAAGLPDPEDLVELFMRPNEMQGRTSIRSSFLFAAFAQWFTDSFLRTSHALDFDKNGNVRMDAEGNPIRLPSRAIFNDSNHEIDLCQIYGLDHEQTDLLRLKDEQDPGCLRYSKGADGEYPAFLLTGDLYSSKTGELVFASPFKELHKNEPLLRFIFRSIGNDKKRYKTLFACGLEHGNSTIGNSLLNTIFLREHNRVARLIAKSEPAWDDERVFQCTRNVMIEVPLDL